VTKTYSLETKMAMFRHRFCYNDYVHARWACKPWTYPSHFLDFLSLNNFFLIFDLSLSSSTPSGARWRAPKSQVLGPWFLKQRNCRDLRARS
jgi:hypothetical protein